MLGHFIQLPLIASQARNSVYSGINKPFPDRRGVTSQRSLRSHKFFSEASRNHKILPHKIGAEAFKFSGGLPANLAVIFEAKQSLPAGFLFSNKISL